MLKQGKSIKNYSKYDYIRQSALNHLYSALTRHIYMYMTYIRV